MYKLGGKDLEVNGDIRRITLRFKSGLVIAVESAQLAGYAVPV